MTPLFRHTIVHRGDFRCSKFFGVVFTVDSERQRLESSMAVWRSMPIEIFDGSFKPSLSTFLIENSLTVPLLGVLGGHTWLLSPRYRVCIGLSPGCVARDEPTSALLSVVRRAHPGVRRRRGIVYCFVGNTDRNPSNRNGPIAVAGGGGGGGVRRDPPIGCCSRRHNNGNNDNSSSDNDCGRDSVRGVRSGRGSAGGDDGHDRALLVPHDPAVEADGGLGWDRLRGRAVPACFRIRELVILRLHRFGHDADVYFGIALKWYDEVHLSTLHPESGKCLTTLNARGGGRQNCESLPVLQTKSSDNKGVLPS